ncbi:hypothetical protein GIB67_041305 [Kingdonia uniflora]|uniref:Pentatricopeptide repeat-containing protein n=1 Tax=Kingdonia uniflora TaxID=39325 RepID=A0A7J7NJ63_9MAGN|nr:hypothetical protein GIB67_041305 [Kingdonia uniflora]
MLGLVKSGDSDGVLGLYNEMKEKVGFVSDGVVYGCLMKGYFQKGMEKEAMDCYNEAVGEDSKFVAEDSRDMIVETYYTAEVADLNMPQYALGHDVEDNEEMLMERPAPPSAPPRRSSDYAHRLALHPAPDSIAYNWVLDALNNNGMFDEAMRLFDRMMEEHNPPGRMSVNLGSFNVIINGYCAQGRFTDAIGVYKRMGEKNCSPDTLSYNNLIEQLCGNEMMAEADELFKEMGEDMVSSPDEFTYMLLVNTCLKKNRVDEASKYFAKMAETLTLRPNAFSFNKII